jgi:hypothetical protein
MAIKILKCKKLKLFLCLIKQHSVKTYWRVEVWLHEFLSAVSGGGELSAANHQAALPHGEAQSRSGRGGNIY